MNQPRIALAGEAHGADEEAESLRQGKPCPFVGAAGQLLNALLKAAGIDRDQCLVTNVFNLRPKDNDLANILVKKQLAAPGWERNPIKRGLYLPSELTPELQRLYAELDEFKPEVIIPLGGTALWALTGRTGIANRHGFLHTWKGIPTIPTYHPASITRKYSQFMPAVNDIRHALWLAQGKIQPEVFEYNDAPTLDDIRELKRSLKPGAWVAVDIETKPKFRALTCIGLGTKDFAICIQFWSEQRPNYWESVEEEHEARCLVAEIVEDPNTTKLLQNALYDLAWLKAVWGMNVRGPVIDTRLMHFAKFPELPHTLAEIASTYLLLPPWKALHTSGGKDGDAAANTLEE